MPSVRGVSLVLFCFRGMQWASVGTKSLSRRVGEDPLELRNLFACDLCEFVEVEEEREYIRMA